MALPESSPGGLSFKDFASQQYGLRVRADFPYRFDAWEMQSGLSDISCTMLERTLLHFELNTELQDPWVYRHSFRTAEIAMSIAERLGLAEYEKTVLKRAARLHDIGKIGIDPAVVNKNGPLTDEEKSMMDTHNRISQAILKYVGMDAEADIVGAHHARIDTGLPVLQQILILADTIDAMANHDDRPYPNHMHDLFAQAEQDGRLGQAVLDELQKTILTGDGVLSADVARVGVTRALEMRGEL